MSDNLMLTAQGCCVKLRLRFEFVFFCALRYPVSCMLPTSTSSAGRGAKIGMVIGGIAVLVGLAATYAEDVRAGIFFTVFFGAIGLFFWYAFIRPALISTQVLQRGESAEATVLSIAESGSSLQTGGAMPKSGIRLELEVRPVGKPSFCTMVTTFVSIFETQKLKPGTVVHVKFDPSHPEHVALVDQTPPLAPYASTKHDDQFDVIERMMIEQKELRASGQLATACIQSVRDTGIVLEGDHPVLEFTLDVHVGSNESFQTTTRSLVRRSSVSEYVPGQTIQVKIDPLKKQAMVIGRL